MGHGHVIPNKDGSKARCGGPSICPECSAEFAQVNLQTKPEEKKTREFWIKTEDGYLYSVSEKKDNNSSYELIHAVEYSALESAQKEIEALKSKCAKYEEALKMIKLYSLKSLDFHVVESIAEEALKEEEK